MTEIHACASPDAIAHDMADTYVVWAQVYRFQPLAHHKTTPSPSPARMPLDLRPLGIFPHIHEAHYENFLNFRGPFQLWTDKYDDGNMRVLGPGDYGAVPHSTTHTFRF